MPELDSLRGVAILLVLLYRGWEFVWGSRSTPKLYYSAGSRISMLQTAGTGWPTQVATPGSMRERIMP